MGGEVSSPHGPSMCIVTAAGAIGIEADAGHDPVSAANPPTSSAITMLITRKIGWRRLFIPGT